MQLGGAVDKVPLPGLRVAIFFLALLSERGSKPSRGDSGGKSVTFSTVIWLIADLDRPQEGALTVRQQALVEVRQTMEPPVQ